MAVAIASIIALGLGTLKGRPYAPWPVRRHWTVYSGTVGRVVSFLGVGVLLLIVGYVAPVPPPGARNKEAA